MGSGIYIFRGGFSPRFSFRFGGRSKDFRLRGEWWGGGRLCFKGFGRWRAGWMGELLALRFIWSRGCAEDGGGLG